MIFKHPVNNKDQRRKFYRASFKASSRDDSRSKKKSKRKQNNLYFQANILNVTREAQFQEPNFHSNYFSATKCQNVERMKKNSFSFAVAAFTQKAVSVQCL